MSRPGSMVGDAVGRLLSEATPAAGFDAALWSRLVGSGVPRLLRPEAQGGAGEAFRDAAAVLQSVGRYAPAVPLADTLVAHWLLARVGIDPDDRPVLLEVPAPDRSPDPPEPTVGAGALDAHRLWLWPWDGPVAARWQPADAAPRELAPADPEALCQALALASAAVLVGAMGRALEMAIEWANLRVQFGRPIGRFQAVQHPLAVAAEEVAAARAACDWAAARLETGRPGPAAWVAKARAAEVAGRVAAVTHQVHGAIGFTAEHPLHRVTRPLWRWRDRWGDETFCHSVLGRLALEAGPERLFDLVIGDDDGPPAPGPAGG